MLVCVSMPIAKISSKHRAKRSPEQGNSFLCAKMVFSDTVGGGHALAYKVGSLRRLLALDPSFISLNSNTLGVECQTVADCRVNGDIGCRALDSRHLVVNGKMRGTYSP